jgi:CP family cyanate transporter-like MFS transporter
MRRKRSVAAALLLVAVNMRLVVAAVPPVLSQIRHATGLSSAAGGLLTSVPVLCFGLVALAAPRLIRRFSMGPLLSLTMLVVVAGAALRLAPSVAMLFLGTVVLGSGIAVGNVLLPGLVKRDFPRQRVVMTALYSVALSGGATTAAGLTVPLEHGFGVGWRVAIALWALLAVVAVLLWTPHVVHEHRQGPVEPDEPVAGLWRDPLAWCVSGFMGFQSFGFYSTLSWLPTILKAHGLSATHAGLMLSLASFAGMLGALLAPSFERRLQRPSVAVLLCIGFCCAGYGGLLAAPGSATFVWCLLFGFGQGAPLALALGYIVGRAHDSHVAAHLSTMAQSVGYLIAATGPFALGALHGATGSWTLPIALLIVMLVPMLATGLVASQDRLVLHASESSPSL